MRFLIDESGHARQFPQSEVAVPITEHDWSGQSETRQEEQLEIWLREDRLRGFDPRAEPPIRVAFFKFGPEHHVLVWTWWHGILDGRSRLMLMRELFTAAEAFQQGNKPTPTTVRSFTQYTRWLAARDKKADMPHWRALLEGFSDPTSVGDVAPQPQAETKGWNFGKHELRLAPELTDQLRAACHDQDITLNTMLQAAWALVLGEFSGQDDVLFGNTRACRHSAFDHDGTGEHVVGSLINTVPVRVRLRAGVRVAGWLRELRDQHLAVRPYELTPLVIIQSCSSVRSDRRLFDSLVVFENQLLDSAVRAPGGRWNARRFEIRGCTGLPLTVYAYGEPGLLMGIANDRARVSDARAEQMLRHLAQAMQSLAKNPDALVTEIPLLPDAERRLLLEEWNRTECAFPAESTMASAFEEQVARTPDAPALTFRGQTWTYRELNEQAERIARRLRAAGARPETLVGVCIMRSAQLVAGLLGVLKAGAAYLPLDPKYPAERIATMVHDAQPLLVLGHESTHSLLSEIGTRVLRVDEDEADATLSPPPDWVPANGRNLAYMIYTSGSTGKPKGVQAERRNVMNFFTAMDRVLGHDPGVVLAVTSVSFDPSIHELFWALTRGYHVVLWRGMDGGEGPSIAELIHTHRVTLMLGVPSFHRMVLGLPGGREALASLRHLVVGGEPLPRELLRELGPDIARRMVNMYGPTETTVAATAWPVEPDAAHIPIGRPLANTHLYLLDRHLRPVPLGATGELFIGGAGVTRGYWKRPELNAEKFIASPFGPAGERLYRTGDLARFLPDGNLDFVGRVDNQVKIRGFRIELGEIDAVLGRHPGVREAIVDAQPDRAGQRQLVAYIVPTAGGTPTRKALREWAARELPGYMVPALFVMLEHLPLATSGKVDRQALPPPTDADKATPETARTATATETAVLNIWRAALGRDHFGLEEDFFELGGNSLTAVQITTAVQKRFGIELPLHTIFETPTIAGLAAEVEKALLNTRPAGPTHVGGMSAPEWTPAQRQLLAIWESLLPVRPIGLRDSFLELQGPLTLVDAMLAEVRKAWGVYAEGLPIAAFLEEPTIEALARTLEGARDATGTLAVCLQPQGDKPPLFLIHAGGGYVFFYRALVARLGRERPVFAIRAESEADGRGRPFHLSESIQQVAGRYLAEIKTIRPRGPYLLGGACIGGIIAYEIARQLEAQGETVAGPVLLFDSFVMNNPHISKAEELQILRAAGIKPPETPAEARRRRLQSHLAYARNAGLLRGAVYLAGRVVRGAPSLCIRGARAVLWRLRGAAPAIPPAPPAVTASSHPEDSLTQLQRKFMNEFMETSKRLQSAYVPGNYSGRLVLFEASESPDPRRLWTRLALGGLVVHDTPGTHLDMMEEPAVINTAALVHQHLAGVNGTTVSQADDQSSTQPAKR